MKAITIIKRNERQRSIPSETLPEPKSPTRKERELVQTVLSWVNERRESSRVNSNNSVVGISQKRGTDKYGAHLMNTRLVHE